MCLETLFGKPDGEENMMLSALCSHIAGLRKSKNMITPRLLLDVIDHAKAGRKDWNRREFQDMAEIFDFILESMKNTSKGKRLHDLFTVEWQTHYPHSGTVADEKGCLFFVDSSHLDGDGASGPASPRFDWVLEQMNSRETGYTSITNLPGAIFFWLNLVQCDMKKKVAKLRLPAELNLSVAMRERPTEDSTYVLYAVVEHMGQQSGHYKIHIHDLEAKEGQAQWVTCNDHTVAQANPSLQDGVFSFDRLDFQIAGFVYLRKEMVKASQTRWCLENIPSMWIERYEEEYQKQEEDRQRWKRESDEIHVSLYSSRDFLVDDDELLLLKLEPKYKSFTILKSESQQVFRQKLCQLAPDLDKERMLIYNCRTLNQGIHTEPVPSGLLRLNEEQTVEKLWSTNEKVRRVFLFEGDAGVNPSSSVLVMFKFYTQDPQNPLQYLGCELLDRSQTELAPLVNRMLGRPVGESHEYLVFKETLQSDLLKPVTNLSALFREPDDAVILVFQDPPKEDFTIEPGVVDSAQLYPNELQNLYSNLIMRRHQKRQILIVPFSAIWSRGAFPPVKVCYSPSAGERTVALALGLESFDETTSRLLYYPFGCTGTCKDSLRALQDNSIVFVRKVPAYDPRFRRNVNVQLEWNGSKRKNVTFTVVFPSAKDCCLRDVVAQLKQEDLPLESFSVFKLVKSKNGTVMKDVTDMEELIFPSSDIGSVTLIFEISSKKVVDRVQSGEARLVRVSSAHLGEKPEQFDDIPRLMAIQRKDTWESVKTRLAPQVKGHPVRYEWRIGDRVASISDESWSFDAIPDGARLVPVLEPPPALPNLSRTDLR